MYLHQSVHSYSIRNLCNGFHKPGMLISLRQSRGFLITGMMVTTTGTVALPYRNGGSQSPDRWLKRSWNTQHFPLFQFSDNIYRAEEFSPQLSLYTSSVPYSLLRVIKVFDGLSVWWFHLFICLSTQTIIIKNTCQRLAAKQCKTASLTGFLIMITINQARKIGMVWH